MTNRRLRVAVLFGGRSAEHEISVLSARSVVDALDPERFEVIAIGITREGRWVRMPDGPPALVEGRPLPTVSAATGGAVRLAQEPGARAVVGDDGTRTEIDVVFPVLHGPGGEDGTIQGFLETADLPFVGSGVLGSAVGMDKAIQKSLLRDAGVPVLEHVVVREHDWIGEREVVETAVAQLGFPVFVKPASLGSSIGVSRVEALGGLGDAVEEALRYGRKAVVERAAVGWREIECAVLGNDEPVASLAGEIVPRGHAFYDYEAKYLDAEGSDLIVPADLTPATLAEVQRLAVASFRALDLAGMARVDFFVSTAGQLVVNEVNTIPGFTRISMYPKLWEASGVPYRDLVARLVDLAIERHDAERRGRA